MRSAGIEGVRGSKRIKTTRPDPASARHPDLVKREFTATAPNRLWVTDLTFVTTWTGRRLRVLHHRRVQQDDRGVAGRIAHTHRDGPQRDRDGPLVPRRPARESAVLHRPVELAQFTSIRYGEPLADIGATPSIGTVGCRRRLKTEHFRR